MKDKIKQDKSVDDYSTVLIPKSSDLVQCPKCLSLFNLGFKHTCRVGWHVCSICSLDLHKKGKEILHNGIKYISFRYKKSFKVVDKTVCWECAFKIVKMFKHEPESR